MSTPLAVGIFFIVWWLVWFAALPFAVRGNEHDERDSAASADAPAKTTNLWGLALITTGVSSVIFAAVYFVIVNRLVPLDIIPFGSGQ